MGGSRLRITVGEPLLRHHLPQLVSQLSGLPGVQDISLSTDATQLHKLRSPCALLASVASMLASIVWISLHGADHRHDSFGSIMAGLQACFDPIKLNMVVMRGANDHEILRMAQYRFEEGFILRLIDAMPMGDTGRNSQYMDVCLIREQLVREFNHVPAVPELGGSH